MTTTKICLNLSIHSNRNVLFFTLIRCKATDKMTFVLVVNRKRKYLYKNIQILTIRIQFIFILKYIASESQVKKVMLYSSDDNFFSY